MRTSVFLVFSIYIFHMIPDTQCLECYVCDDQDTNYDKCVKTVKTCESYETWCLTKVKWGATPYWEAGDKKQYYISKQCSTQEHCLETRQRLMPRCDRVWYNEWECAECCPGDRCNYYAVLGASSIRSNTALLGIGLLLLIICFRFR